MWLEQTEGKSVHDSFLATVCMVISRKAWKALGNKSQEDAQVSVIKLLEGVCPQLKDVVLNDYKQAVGQQLQNQQM